MIILASGSPRRKELLGRLGVEFKVWVSNAEESRGACALEEAQCAARSKAQAARACFANEVVLAADTVVSKGSKIYGKPKDNEQALDFFKELCGGWHEVITAVCVIKQDRLIEGYAATRVRFEDFERCKQQILHYIDSGMALDKAGAYGLQDFKGSLVAEVVGDEDNVVGLPLAVVKELLAQLGAL